MKTQIIIPCISKFNILQFLPRSQNGLIIMFYYYLISLTFCKSVNFIIMGNNQNKTHSLAYKIFIAGFFFNIGYHLDPNDYSFT